MGERSSTRSHSPGRQRPRQSTRAPAGRRGRARAPHGGSRDLPFAIGLLLYETADYEDALEFFGASLEQHGPDAATEHDIALCEAQLD